MLVSGSMIKSLHLFIRPRRIYLLPSLLSLMQHHLAKLENENSRMELCEVPWSRNQQGDGVAEVTIRSRV